MFKSGRPYFTAHVLYFEERKKNENISSQHQFDKWATLWQSRGNIQQIST